MQNKTHIYKCPVCQAPLIKNVKQYICSKNHTYDISEKGYVNLMLANQKKSKNPGDNKEMMESRKNFLNHNYYEKFSIVLGETILEELKSDKPTILDAGCGEGYYISNLKNLCQREAVFYGMDISKNAILYAVKRDKEINFSVGSSFDLPFIDNSLDCVIRNFAPGDDREFRRVLTKGSILVIATPGIEHLYGLKAVLYDTPRKNPIKTEEIDGFEHIRTQNISYSISIDNNEDIKNLISMTPYYWSITEDMRKRIGQIWELVTELDFNIDVYKKLL
jgi:23S rRNA (guanine745-N1)-methyltransferase